jgi:processive 1,2-diacylglycerol beta-glucosyltransferase
LRQELAACVGIEVLTGDLFSFAPGLFGRSLLKVYLWLLRHWPSSYDFLYKWGDQGGSLFLRAIVNRLFFRGARNFLAKAAPDAIIATHVTPGGLAALYKAASGQDIPLFGVVTDYAMHRWWLYDELTAYIVADRQLFVPYQELLRTGQKVWALGIPVSRDFSPAADKSVWRDRLALPESGFICVLSGGGEGLLNMESLAVAWREEAARYPQVTLVAVCGRNQALARRLRRLALPYLRVEGFIDNIADYMKAADIMISKAGGVTAAEAAACQLPLAIYQPLPGQELLNLNRLVRAGLALSLATERDFCRLLAAACRGECPDLDKIKERQAVLGKPTAAWEIARQVVACVKAADV